MQKLLRAKQLGFDFSLLLLVYLQRDLLGISNNLGNGKWKKKYLTSGEIPASFNGVFSKKQILC